MAYPLSKGGYSLASLEKKPIPFLLMMQGLYRNETEKLTVFEFGRLSEGEKLSINVSTCDVLKGTRSAHGNLEVRLNREILEKEESLSTLGAMSRRM